MMGKFNFFLTLLVLLTVSSCSEDLDNRGYVTKFSDFSKITPNQTSKDEVLSILGSPTTKTVYGKEQWIYAGLEETKETFFEPEVRSYKAYIITFNNDGIAEKVEKKDGNSTREFQISQDKTVTGGSEVTVIQQLLGNLGKFNPMGSDGPRSAGVLGGGR